MSIEKGHLDEKGFFETLAISKADFLTYHASLNQFQVKNLDALLSAIRPGLVPPLIAMYLDNEGKRFFRIRAGYYSIMEPYSIPYFEGFEKLFNLAKKLDIVLSVTELVKEAKNF